MPLLVSKADELIFNTWAVARPSALDLPRVHRRQVQIIGHHLPRLRPRVSHPARHLVFTWQPPQLALPRMLHMEQFMFRLTGALFGLFHVEHIIHSAGIVKSKQGRLRIALLLFELAKIDTAAQNTCGRASFKTLELDTRFLKRCREPFCRDIPHPSALVGVLADVHQATQKRTCGDHHRLGIEIDIQISLHTHHAPILIDQALHHCLKQVEVSLQLQHVLHPVLIRLLIALRPRRLHRGALRSIQQPKLNGRGIRIDCHLTTQGIDLAHHVTLSLATNRWIAAHLSDGI